MRKFSSILVLTAALIYSPGFASNDNPLEADEIFYHQALPPKTLPSKTVVIDLPKKDPIILDEVIASSHYYHDRTLQDIIDEEIQKKPKSSLGYKKVTSLSVEDAERILTLRFKKLLLAAGKNEEECESLLQQIFTPRHFEIKFNEISDILTLSEEKVFEFLTGESNLLGPAIFLTRDDYDHMAEQKHRIDPRVFLLPAETVRKWFYTQYPTWEKKSLEDYEAADKTLLRPHLFSTYFTFPTNHEERSAHYRNNALSFLTQKMVKDIRTTAQKIIDATTEQERIVIFGNTPYFVGRAMEYLLQNSMPSQKRTLIHLPFSGAPNKFSERNAFSATDDVVTAERYAHFKNRLETLGLSPANPSMMEGTTYFVDVIGSGSGPAFTMETILREFSRQNHETHPNFEIIALNEFLEDDDRNMAIASKPANDGETVQLSFPSKESCHFSVPARVFYLEGHGQLDFIPDQCPATRIVPKFNAKFWSPSFDHILKAPLNSMAQILVDHFDENLKALD